MDSNVLSIMLGSLTTCEFKKNVISYSHFMSPSCRQLPLFLISVLLTINHSHGLGPGQPCLTTIDCGGHPLECYHHPNSLWGHPAKTGTCQCRTFYGLKGPQCHDVQVPVSKQWSSQYCCQQQSQLEALDLVGGRREKRGSEGDHGLGGLSSPHLRH